MWVVCNIGGSSNVECHKIVYDDHNKFKDVGRDELSVIVILLIQKDLLLDVFWNRQMPPVLEHERVAAYAQ